jgi:hypothetical protein
MFVEAIYKNLSAGKKPASKSTTSKKTSQE